ncbi:myb-like protein X [Zerene cesonia]|uniref:myb-like protein X n=1 Tax=Zerene cesonia TaxID=33412 RepID=UPI0018E4ECFD|nr:myb-like protein X [Zerene cesonia]
MDSGGSKDAWKPSVKNLTQSPTSMDNITMNKQITVTSSAKGVENAKKRLRAFSIQKKTPLTPVVTPKPSGSGNTMVLIGKLSSVKVTPKAEDQEPKQKQPKPPKPGAVRKALQDSYTELQRRTLADIEDMKRKMELVDLGIPLGLICPTSTSEKAMPTKAMPPIKSFIDPAKVDELIREAKKAKMEGREFKFDYQKLLPGYDNPFQNKKKEEEKEKEKKASDSRKNSDRRKSDKYSSKRYSEYRKEDKFRDRDRSRQKDREKGSEYKSATKKESEKTAEKETDVNLSDYLVCDSWSLDNDEKTNSSSPKFDDKSDSQSSSLPETKNYREPSDIVKTNRAKKNELIKNSIIDKPPLKLQPVMDSFKYEIDDNEEEVLDIFDADSNIEKFAKVKPKKLALYDSPVKKCLDLDDSSRDLSLDGINDDTFLESVINEIKVSELSDDSQDKGLVEYDISPVKDDDTPKTSKSVTPELDSKMDRKQSDYSDGYRSSESGYKTSDTTESGYKSETEFRLSIEKELDDALNASKMSKATVDSLEAWSFVLKICQPLLFRHDRNKCYKETRTDPKLWWTTNPRGCPCVKDRSVVYEELEMCKMSLVDRVYGCDQISDEPFPKCRNWYPASGACLVEGRRLQPSSEWEGEDSQQPELSLDREYQRFMEAVWPEVMDSKKEASRSTTPVQENRKKRKEESVEKKEDEKKAKKIKLSSEGWSQESEVEEEDKNKKMKKVKPRKRKHSTSVSSSPSDSEEDSKKKKKALKKKALKKVKSKSAKRRRMGKKLLKKLKEKQKKSKKMKERDLSDDDDDSDSDKKERKSKKKKQEKAKKKDKKKKKAKVRSSSSDSSSSDSSSESSDSDRRKRSKKKNHDKSKKKTKKSDTKEELFDVNILNNIKTEKITDDEGPKLMEFSPRRQKPREIINVKELQNDFVGNNMIIKKEVEDKQAQSEVKSIEDEEVKEKESEKDNVQIEIEGENEVVVEKEKEASNEVDSELHLVEEDSQNSSVEKAKDTTKESGEESEGEMSMDYEMDTKQEPEEKEVEKSPNKSIEAEVTPEEIVKTPVDDASQCSSQESICSVKEVGRYAGGKEESPRDALGYELYEQLALAHQHHVALRPLSPVEGGVSRIETVVRARCGEIKCDWRAGAEPAPPAPRPSRWGLKPGEVNIVLTGGEPVYRIQSLANRTDGTPISYDEAYMDTYGASDRLQYGDCFSSETEPATFTEVTLQEATEPEEQKEEHKSTLDDRINQALRDTVLGDVAKELDTVEADKEEEKGILLNRSAGVGVGKRVRFADGYAPGQDSDTEPPPKRRRARRYGCAWPCPASHPDHVSLWDALPPPPPPPGSPPRPRPRPQGALPLPLAGFMPPEPPPGLIALH